jgi:hypothetical protein
MKGPAVGRAVLAVADKVAEGVELDLRIVRRSRRPIRTSRSAAANSNLGAAAAHAAPLPHPPIDQPQ